MDSQDNFFADDITSSMKSSPKKIDDFANLKNNTMDFLSHERLDEKVDAEKPKADIDDFLNFHDDVGDEKPQEDEPVLLSNVEKFEELIEDPKVFEAEPEADFHAIEDEYLNPYASPNLKSLTEPTNEKFISSEDLLTDFKDPIPAPAEPELPEPVEPAPKPFVIEKPPVVEPVKPVQEPPKPKTAPPPAPVRHQTSDDTQIEAEKLFKSIGLDAWFKPDRLHPKVESLIYWRDVKKSGVVFGIGLAILLAMSMFSLISVFAYLSLLTLVGTISFKIYKTVMSAVQKTSEGHPFKEVLDFDLTLSPEKVQNIAGVAVTHINAYVAELRRLFLVEDLVDSLKFALLLWFLTYIGAIFNGMTVVILSYIAMFTLPKVYETNKQSIDQHLDVVRSKIMEITDKVKAAIPAIGGAKKEESVKKDE